MITITDEQRERYNATRRLKRQMEARRRKAEKLQCLKQTVESQTYLNDSAESLEYYRLLNPTREVEVWDGTERMVFDTALCAAKYFNLDVGIIRRLVNGQYSTTQKHTKGRFYFAPAGYYKWLGQQTVKIPNLDEEIKRYIKKLKGYDT